MDPLSSPYLKKITLVIKAGTTLNARGQLSYPILLLVTLACTLVIICDFVGFYERGVQYETLRGRVYEAPLLIFLILHIPILIHKRSNISELIQLLIEPFDKLPFGEGNYEAVKDFFKLINLIGTIVIFNNFFLFACCIMVLGPLFALPFYPINTIIQDLPLPVGVIPFQTDSYSVYAAFYIISSFSILAVCAFHSSWFLLLVFSSLKIKARLSMLVHAIDTMDERAGKCSMDLIEIAQSCRLRLSEEDTLVECTEYYLSEAISEHVKIIRYVKLVSDTFSLSLSVFIQGAMLVCALLLSQVVDVSNRTLLEYPHKVHMIFAGLFNIWVFSHCGQIIITEQQAKVACNNSQLVQSTIVQSMKFRFALYHYDWTNKSDKIKNGIAIMMSVATRPLHILVGGAYYLSLTTYRITLLTISFYTQRIGYFNVTFHSDECLPDKTKPIYIKEY